MPTDTVLIVAGLMDEGCVAVLDSDGVPDRFVAPSSYAGPSARQSYTLRYGPTSTSCLLVLTSQDPGRSVVESVSRFDVVSGDLVDVPVALPELKGSILRLDFVAPDGSVVDVVYEKQGRSYGRSFLARVSDGRVVSRDYLPVRATFNRDYQFVVKRRKDGLSRALRIDRTTGEARELLLARSAKGRLDVHSVGPDRSLVLIERTEWRSSQEVSRQTRQSLFDTVTGQQIGEATLSGGETFTEWLGTTHLAVTIYNRDFIPTTRILRVPDLVPIGEVVGWPSALRTGLRDGRIWGIDERDGSSWTVVSAPIGGGPITTHHHFRSHERPGVFHHGILTMEIDEPETPGDVAAG